MPRLQYQQTGNNHFLLLIPDNLPPLGNDGDTFVTQVSWFWSPNRLTTDPFPHLPLDPAPPRAIDNYRVNWSDIWITDWNGIRYGFLGLLAAAPPAFAAQTWTVTVVRCRIAPQGDDSMETLRSALEGLRAGE